MIRTATGRLTAGMAAIALTLGTLQIAADLARIIATAVSTQTQGFTK